VLRGVHDTLWVAGRGNLGSGTALSSGGPNAWPATYPTRSSDQRFPYSPDPEGTFHTDVRFDLARGAAALRTSRIPQRAAGQRHHRGDLSPHAFQGRLANDIPPCCPPGSARPGRAAFVIQATVDARAFTGIGRVRRHRVFGDGRCLLEVD